MSHPNILFLLANLLTMRSLRVRKMGPDRKRFSSHTILLEPDVAEIFPDSESVNEALRFLIRVTRERKPVVPGTG